MTQFKAGDKIVYGNKIATFFKDCGNGISLIDIWGGQRIRTAGKILPAIVFRILDNGRAREEPELSSYRFGDTYDDDLEAWREAESGLRELPCVASGLNTLAAICRENKTWYAYIDTIDGQETFVLVKPKEE